MDFYHVLNRGVDKRDIVLNDKDRVRFIHDLYVFNDEHATPNYILPIRKAEHPRNLLVHIHAFCLMKNHYHLLLSEAQPNGISLFMKKMNMGYAKYFNEKYNRTGALWQGKYRKKKIDRDAYFMYIPYYIHLNPLDFSFPAWRRGKIKNPVAALEKLEKYRWSSHLDFLGVVNFPSITNRSFLSEILGNPEHYKKEIRAIINDPARAAASERIELKN